jgi:hypothetical protein
MSFGFSTSCQFVDKKRGTGSVAYNYGPTTGKAKIFQILWIRIQKTC